MSIPRVLTIAGSDSSGGAGIEADLKTFTAHGCYGMTCITGLTAQNTAGVKQIYPIESQEMICNTLDAVFQDVGADAVKTGMLTTNDTVSTIVDKLHQYNPKYLVIDPVMVSTSGADLISKDAIDGYINKLFSIATVITPNLEEAKFILDRKQISYDSRNLNDLKDMAKKLQQLGCKSVLLKGGHAGMDSDFNIVSNNSNKNATHIVDILYCGDTGEHTIYTNKFIESKNTHGTGCTLASAIASNLSKQVSLTKSAELAIDYVQQAIISAPNLGKGSNGPINHLHQLDIRPFSKGKFIDWLINHPKVQPIWERYVNHPFTKQIANGTVDQQKFQYFLTQDYHYLRHYSRAHSLAGFKANEFDTINASASIVQHIRHELDLHISYCKKFNLSVEEIENTPESQACTAYTRYLLDIGQKEDWLTLQIALSPCLFGYLQAAELRSQEITDPLLKDESKNPYYRWVLNYLADDYQQASETGRHLLETHIMNCSASRLDELVDIFATASQMECSFWDACM